MKTKIGLFLLINLTLPQLAHGQATTTNSPPVTELKNPVVLHVLQDGKVVQLSGQWLYTKDGTPVLVPVSPLPEAPSAASAPVVESGQSFILLVPAAVSAPVVLQPQYYRSGFAAQTSYTTPNWYQPNRGWYGGWSGGRHYYHHGASARNMGPRFVRHSDGALRLAATHSLRENPQFYERSPGVFALRPTRRW